MRVLLLKSSRSLLLWGDDSSDKENHHHPHPPFIHCVSTLWQVLQCLHFNPWVFFMTRASHVDHCLFLLFVSQVLLDREKKERLFVSGRQTLFLCLSLRHPFLLLFFFTLLLLSLSFLLQSFLFIDNSVSDELRRIKSKRNLVSWLRSERLRETSSVFFPFLVESLYFSSSEWSTWKRRDSKGDERFQGNSCEVMMPLLQWWRRSSSSKPHQRHADNTKGCKQKPSFPCLWRAFFKIRLEDEINWWSIDWIHLFWYPLLASRSSSSPKASCLLIFLIWSSSGIIMVRVSVDRICERVKKVTSSAMKVSRIISRMKGRLAKKKMTSSKKHLKRIFAIFTVSRFLSRDFTLKSWWWSKRSPQFEQREVISSLSTSYFILWVSSSWLESTEPWEVTSVTPDGDTDALSWNLRNVYSRYLLSTSSLSTSFLFLLYWSVNWFQVSDSRREE